MNFLAHLYLSRHDDGLMIGNFIADSVKGNPENYFSGTILNGIKMHREIDFFTDNHPVNKQFAAFLRPHFGKFSGVVVDMFHDYFLATNWPLTSPLLSEFAKYIYSLMTESIQYLPEKSQILLPYMVKYNWLGSYATIDGIDTVCKGMHQRIKAENNLHLAGNFLLSNKQECFEFYNAFFPALEQEFTTNKWD